MYSCLQVRVVDVASVCSKDGAFDSLSSGVSPRTPLEFSHESALRAASPVTPISNSETSRSMHAW